MPLLQVVRSSRPFSWIGSTPNYLAILASLILLLVAAGHPAYADGPGQADLDEATLKKLTAQNMADLEKAIELCESALEKGLDDENTKYAEGLLTACLYEHASRLSRLIFDQRPLDPRWPAARRVALKHLERAVEVDPQMGSAQLLIARLQALTGGDLEKAQTAITTAIELLTEEPTELSKAYVIRGGISKDPEKMLADFDQAIELDPRNMDAWRVRGLYYMSQQQNEKALDDFQRLLESDPNDLAAHQAVARTLQQMKQFDKALEHLEEVIQTKPNSSIPYKLKAQILEENGKLSAAIDSLNQAIRVSSQDLGALITRARLLTAEGQFDLAENDIDRVLQLNPQMPQAILLRSLIAAAQEKYDEAIGDLQQLLRLDPDNADIKVQMGTYYEFDKQPSRAIALYDEVLENKPDQWGVLRRRGDAYLSLGQQAKAVENYEAALKLRPEDSGILNNLAWVLATSPNDDLRNGDRAIELAERACEATDYKQAHILSTLAAGYAELGNFDEAVKWSEKAVEMDSDEEQLANELESYREKKPWRERQNVETENPTNDQTETADPQQDDSALKDAGLEDELPAEEETSTETNE